MTDLEQIIHRRQLRFRALDRMAADLEWLLSLPAGSVAWLGTQRDLVEMVHLVWQQRKLIDTLGLPLSQAELARRAFAAVGRRLPTRLTRVVSDLGERLSDDRSMVRRYERLDGETNIINHFISINTL